VTRVANFGREEYRFDSQTVDGVVAWVAKISSSAGDDSDEVDRSPSHVCSFDHFATKITRCQAVASATMGFIFSSSDTGKSACTV